MKHLESWLQLESDATRKEKKHERIDVISVNMYMDSFGKYYTESKPFDTFSTISKALEYKDTLVLQARNCFSNFQGFKL